MAGPITRPAATFFRASIIRSSSPTRRARSQGARLSITDRRNVLRLIAACMADWWLPRRGLAQRREPRKPDPRGIVVTFGGGVRYEDTLAREGWINIPHLATELVPQGLVYPVA